jgi:UDP-2,4-diacetamido-2,4,6-trideoxy-beta-L-altropyranose hydrolase
LKTKVYLRADGDYKIGLGHVHRLLALSEILKYHFDCIFIINNPLPGVLDLILETCIDCISINPEIKDHEFSIYKQRFTSRDIVVLDGYKFDTQHQQEIRKLSGSLVCIDDIHNYHFLADVIINPAGGIREFEYSKEKDTLLFTGPHYALLKSVFQNQALGEKKDGEIFICLGGADPENHTLKTLKHCRNHFSGICNVVVGEAYSHLEGLYLIANAYGESVRIWKNLKPSALADLMGQCAVAVCSASGVAYEFITTGGETYILQTADNQHSLYQFLINESLAFDFSDFRIKDKERIDISIIKQQQFFDGNTPLRIQKIFQGLDFKLNVAIRKALASDVLILLEWANDPDTRRQSYNTSSISLQSHEQWFKKKLNDPAAIVLIFEYKNCPAALVRFDIEERALMSYSIDKKFRGRGWGSLVVEGGIRTMREHYKKTIPVTAFVKYDNISSNKIFLNLGFTQKKSSAYPDSYQYDSI